jgi:hypothetical protein
MVRPGGMREYGRGRVGEGERGRKMQNAKPKMQNAKCKALVSAVSLVPYVL